MVLTLDSLAYRYKCLPSEVLERANTLDLHVMDIANRWTKKQREDADNERTGGKSVLITPKLSIEQMKAMLDSVKQERK
jgi:hypothetical protein